MSDELRRLRDATRARPDAAARVKAATAGALSPEDLKALLRTVPAPPPGAAARVKAGAEAIVARPRRPWLRAGLAALLAGAIALPAGLLATAPRADRAVALDVQLGQRVVVGGLAVEADGHGTLSGTRAAPRLDWQDGHARIAAEDLWLATREAEVRLSGQALSVDRDVTGTILAAERGTAHVRCLADGAARDVAPGATLTCPPVSAEGMLGRARSERAAGADAAVVLATVESGLARPMGADAARAELAVLRMQVHAEDGHPLVALAEARAWLATGATLRRPEVERLAAGLALTHEGCDGARPHLAALAPTSLDAALRLAACTPEAAARVLDAAAPLAVTPEDREALATTRSRLGVP